MEEEYRASGAGKVFKAPKPELTDEEKKQQIDMEKERYLKDPDEEDLSQQVNYSEKVGPDDIIIEGLEEEKAKFGERDKAIQAAGKAKRKGYLTDEDYLDRLKDAARIPLNTIISRTEKPRQVLTSIFIPDPTDFNEMSELFIDFKTAGAYATKAGRIHPLVGVGAGILGFNQRRILERLATNIEFLGDGTLAKKLVDPSIDVPTYFAARRTNPQNLGNQPSMSKGSGGGGSGGGPPLTGKYYKEGIRGKYEVTPHMKEKLQIHDRAFNEEMLAFDSEALLRRSIIDKQLDPKGPIIIRAGADLKRKRSAYLLSGEEITPAVDAAFLAEGHQILSRYEKKLGLSVGEVDIHHKGLLRQIYESTNGLNAEFRLKSAKFMQNRLGHELGYAKSAAEPLPKQFHRRLHNLINKRIGIGGYNLKGIEKKLGLPKNWQEVLTYDERLPIYREIIDTIADSEKQIKTFWNGLLRRKDLTKLTRDNYMDTVLEVLELDKRLEKTPGIGFSAGSDTTASEIINDILIKAGRIDLSLPIFQQLSKAKSEEAARIIMQTNGRKALLEAVEANKSIDTVFDAYKVQGDRKLVKSVMKTWKKRFPNQPERLKQLINETDLEGKHADLKLLEKLIQDPDF